MSADHFLSVEPWAVREPSLQLDRLPQTESIFALSNGHIGLRGNLDEGEPHGTPGTYLNGFFESLPLPHGEGGYGYPEEGQSLINVTNGKLIRLLVDDEPLDVRHGRLLCHERVLDLRDGTLRRGLEWTSPAGQAVRVQSTRLVSFVQRAIAAIRYEVEPIGDPARIVVQSTLVANEPVADRPNDPRAAAALRAPLVGEYHANSGMEVALGHRTRSSGLRMAAGLDHLYDCPQETLVQTDSQPDLARVTFSTVLEPGESLVVVKLIGYGWSSVRSMPALRDQVDATLAAARQVGWDGLLDAQRRFLGDMWSRADVVVEGDDELQQALRYALFQVVQAAARAEQRAIPAKGLTGRGYDGHTFWDAETYTLPVLTYTAPLAARDALAWRHSTIGLARDRARVLQLAGAAFPWRTIRGEECSAYWPASTAAFHINADIADAVRRYVRATEDDEFERGAGFELLVETARMWASLGHHDVAGRFHINGVTGPDEYTALVDNNVFTNLMAARNLRAAADVARRHHDRAAEFGIARDEIATWSKAADAMVVPFDEDSGVTQQSEGFTRYRPWDFESTRPEQYPLLLHFPYYRLYSSRVVKQADLVHAIYLCCDQFDRAQKLLDFDYYEAITVRDSSLSASVQAIVAAEVGHLDLAYAYFRETALIDLHDAAGNVVDGLHLASLSGAWLVAIAGFGGMRDHGDQLAFSPRLVPPLTRLSFRLSFRSRLLEVEVSPSSTIYRLLEGDAITVTHHGEPVQLVPEIATKCAHPPASEVAPVRPPPGRGPNWPGVGTDP
jgi:alpha,alpha-trehalose phosphorylase